MGSRSDKDLKVPEDNTGPKDPQGHPFLYTVNASRTRGLLRISRYMWTIGALWILRAIPFYTQLMPKGLEV